MKEKQRELGNRVREGGKKKEAKNGEKAGRQADVMRHLLA